MPASIVALVVLGVCVVVAITEIEQLAGYQPPLIPFPAAASYGQSLQFSDTPVIIAGAVAAAVGLILLACGTIPGKPTVLPLARLEEDVGAETGTAIPTDAGVGRARLRGALRYALAETDGIARVRVRVKRRKVTAKIRTERRDVETVRGNAHETLDRYLNRTGLARRPRLRVTVKSHRPRRAA
jgi:hypothetical protein